MNDDKLVEGMCREGRKAMSNGYDDWDGTQPYVKQLWLKAMATALEYARKNGGLVVTAKEERNKQCGVASVRKV